MSNILAEFMPNLTQGHKHSMRTLFIAVAMLTQFQEPNSAFYQFINKSAIILNCKLSSVSYMKIMYVGGDGILVYVGCQDVRNEPNKSVYYASLLVCSLYL